MKIFSALFIVFLLCACSSSHEVGVVSTQWLVQEYPEFQPKLDTQDTGTEALAQSVKANEATHVVVYFGVWCHDSVRELPHIIALLEANRASGLSYELYGLDYRKQDPADRAKAHRIFRTPTIVVEWRNKEIGRITERPNESWATDLAKILNAPRG